MQQHQDIIAANAAAKAAGVRKHCAPAEARRLLAPAGGRVVHVHLEPGGRVSYKPYRRAGGDAAGTAGQAQPDGPAADARARHPLCGTCAS